MTAARSQATGRRLTHAEILGIALPIMASNISEPLLGAVDTAVIGQMPQPYLLGAVALGSSIFSVLFWGFGFLRMGTTGLTAQAFGAADVAELRAVLGRALLIAVACGFMLILLAPVIDANLFRIIDGSADLERETRAYVLIRIWAAPFALMNYAFLGWFIGLGNTRIAFLLQVLLNITNIILDVIFVLVFEWGVPGVAAGTVIASAVAAVAGLAIARREIVRRGGHWDLVRLRDMGALRRMLAVNGDIMIRSLLLVLSFAFFTAQGARFGDVTLAANGVLMIFLNMYAYLLDGFAFAAEALTGRFIGARDLGRFRQAVRMTTVWAGGVGMVLVLVTLLIGDRVIDLLTVSSDVREMARVYLPWAAAAPILGVWCFQLDGIFIGATQTRDMRNMSLITTAIFFAAWWLLLPWGNHGLWATLMIFYLARAATLLSRYPALERERFALAASAR